MGTGCEEIPTRLSRSTMALPRVRVGLDFDSALGLGLGLGFSLILRLD